MSTSLSFLDKANEIEGGLCAKAESFYKCLGAPMTEHYFLGFSVV